MEKAITDFVPVLSEKNVLFICDILENNEIDLIIEYGSGASTIFFVEKVKNTACKFVSVENKRNWFFHNIEIMKSLFRVNNSTLNREFWNNKKYNEFLISGYKPYTPIIDGSSRFAGWARKLELGPFIRFDPIHNSRLSGKFGPFWNYFKPVFISINRFIRMFPRWRQENSTFETRIDNIDFTYRLISPGIKDQFGESPTRQEYSNAGGNFLLSSDFNNILIMIDGGPRHFIVDDIFSKIADRKNIRIHLCLFDAFRKEYASVLSKYPGGKFFPGNAVLLDGKVFYDEADSNVRLGLQKELWYYLIEK